MPGHECDETLVAEEEAAQVLVRRRRIVRVERRTSVDRPRLGAETEMDDASLAVTYASTRLDERRERVVGEREDELVMGLGADERRQRVGPRIPTCCPRIWDPATIVDDVASGPLLERHRLDDVGPADELEVLVRLRLAVDVILDDEHEAESDSPPEQAGEGKSAVLVDGAGSLIAEVRAAFRSLR
jgi:hypothetical protein